ncbi:peptidylprolyl isomerase [Hyphococcus sp.]|jgi:peptidyl-prolyl cis-trans isomerase C|uniref:peptidylprolyl isomerase n=1 Tax=Hyphococcus sp. TaxID=2038636 RepID=UPI003D14AE17
MMETPDKTGEQGPEAAAALQKKGGGAGALWRAAAGGTLWFARLVWTGIVLAARGFGKFCITTWRVAAALDSALWRAVKLLTRRALDGLAYAGGIALTAFRGLIAWLPTRTGRAYSSLFGAFLVVCTLWMIDLLRASPALDIAGSSSNRAPVDEDDPILARIDGRYVHLSEIEAAARAGGFLRPDEILTPGTAFERELVESYVEQRLLARAALDEGLQRSPSVARKVNAARDRVLAGAYMDAQIRDTVTPEAVERLYRSQSDVTRLGDEVRARHILVATGEEAEEIIALLKGGADFTALARERSLDRATAPLGGEVGWFTRGMMTPVFSNAAFSAEPGTLAAPFQTEFGWHILEVLDRRPTSAVPFSSVRAPIESFLRMRTIESSLRDLEEKSQVVYFRPQAKETPSGAQPPDLSDPPLDDPRFMLPAEEEAGDPLSEETGP